MRHHGVPLLLPLNDANDAKMMIQQTDFKIILLQACFRLLMLLHQNAWVHGDTHLGNFMLDPATWRIYLIDAERSFPSAEPVQYLLDAQELFGHATGLLISLQNRCSWDMTDIWAVMSTMHPANKKADNARLHGPLVCFIPVCTCFVHEHVEQRLNGCKMCKSRLNSTQAALYLSDSERWADKTDQRMLAALSYTIKKRREECRTAVQDIACMLSLHVPAIHKWLTKQKRLHRKPDTDQALLMHILSAKSAPKIKMWLNFILYHGAILKNGSNKAIRIAGFLAACGLPELSHQFFSATAEYFCCPTAAPPPAIM